MERPDIKEIELNIMKRFGRVGVLEKHHLDDIKRSRKRDEKIVKSIEWYLSNDNVTQIVRQRLQRLLPALVLPPLPLDSENKDQSQNRKNLLDSFQ